CQQNRDWPFTF
nr:immunoglobulin light chain junction region [Macaca mulatta]